MKLKFKVTPESLPLGTEELLQLLDVMVGKEMFRPGDNVPMATYNAGARDLVDWLIQRFEQDKNPIEVQGDNWYDHDPELKSFIEGAE